MGLVLNRTDDDFEKGWGLFFDADGRVTWGMDSGWGQWLPRWFKQAICTVLNSLACMRHGHSDFDVLYWKLEPKERFEPPHCTYCGTELPVDGKYVTEDQLVKPHWRDVPPVPGIDYPLDFTLPENQKLYGALVAAGVTPWDIATEDYAIPSDPSQSSDSDEPLN